MIAARVDHLCGWLNGLDHWSSRALMLCVLIALWGVWLGALWVFGL